LIEFAPPRQLNRYAAPSQLDLRMPMAESNDFDELKRRLFEIARQTTDPFKAQWDARKDVAKTLVSLASGALVFTITFASSLIKPNTPASLRYSIGACWLAFIFSLVLALLSLWFSIGLHNFEGLLVSKNEQINQLAADNRESLPSLVADTWQEIVRDDKRSRRSLTASLVFYGIALLIFSIIGIRQLVA
jgi:hypothetical protein